MSWLITAHIASNASTGGDMYEISNNSIRSKSIMDQSLKLQSMENAWLWNWSIEDKRILEKSVSNSRKAKACSIAIANCPLLMFYEVLCSSWRDAFKNEFATFHT
jgi:hypothetical protein